MVDNIIIEYINNKEKQMIPYRPTKVFPRRMTKLKPIPSPELMGILSSLCDQTVNTYDRKNHVLTIRDIEEY
jgi:hypothetical protein